jgi:hypothetical protein
VTAIGAAVLASLADWIDGRLGNEHADRRTICETVAVRLRDMATALRESGEDGTEPYCTTCGQWAGMFLGMDGWHHFRGDPAPGGVRELYDAGHQAVIGWTRPAVLAPAELSTVLDCLAVAAEYRRYRASLTCQACADHPAELCEDHQADLDAADAYGELAGRIGGTR